MEELKSVVEQFVDDKESVIVEKPKEIEQSLIIKREMKASTVVYVYATLLRKTTTLQWSKKSSINSSNA